MSILIAILLIIGHQVSFAAEADHEPDTPEIRRIPAAEEWTSVNTKFKNGATVEVKRLSSYSFQSSEVVQIYDPKHKVICYAFTKGNQENEWKPSCVKVDR